MRKVKRRETRLTRMLARDMKRRNLTQRAVAIGAGISEGTLSKIVRGKMILSCDHAIMLGQFFECDGREYLYAQVDEDYAKALRGFVEVPDDTNSI